MMFERTFKIDDVPLDVEFEATEYHAANAKRPAEGGEITIESVSVKGHYVTELLSDFVINKLKDMAGSWYVNIGRF